MPKQARKPMPAWKDSIGEEGIRNVAGYIRTLSGLKNPEGIEVDLAAGQNIFATNCAVCHGAEGKGNQDIGAPNLSDNIWLHGAGEADIIKRINEGKINQMPAQEAKFTPAQIQVLAAYVWGLSNK